MLKEILDITIERVRQRDSEGDCPITPAFSVEHLETALLTLEHLTGYRNNSIGSKADDAGRRVADIITSLRDFLGRPAAQYIQINRKAGSDLLAALTAKGDGDD